MKRLFVIVLTLGLTVFFLPKGLKKLEKAEEKEPELTKIEMMLNNMSIEEKVGQMFIVRHPEENGLDKIKEYHLGGYILFARDFESITKEDLITKLNEYQNNSSIPMFIGVDEEGGTVNRVSKFKTFRATPFLSSQELYNQGGYEAIIEDTKEKSRLLKELGINVNFAPVSDVSTNPNDYIYKRTFGKSADQTAVYVESVVKTMKQEKIGSVLKHFPGYGNNVDTHAGISIDTRSLDTFQKEDFLPFISGIKAGTNMVMVSHNIINSMDTAKPASLSSKVNRILREDLSFDGIIITDDLVMNAIKKYAEDEEAVAVEAILAGNDLLCVTDFEVQIPAVINAVKSGKISEKRLDESVIRILKEKESLGLI